MFSLLIVFHLLAPSAHADECESLTNYRALIKCISVRAPDVQRSELEVKIADAEVDRARQIPNPELESRNLWPTGGSTGGSANETQLLFPLQLGGKRSALTQVARAEKESAAALAQTTREKTLIESAQALHRLRQLETELFLATEAIERFERIISAFRKRPQLSPEQSVSLTVFKYALEEEKQKRAQGLAEQSSILADLSLAVGKKIQIKKDLLPIIPEKWPVIQNKLSEESAELKLARARSQEMNSRYSLAKAESWPTLKIGPSYERMPDRERMEERFGVGLSMELPIFNQNSGGRRSGELSGRIGALNSDQAKRQADLRFESLLEQYQLVTKALATAPNQAQLEKGHKDFEGHFNRGLVSYSLIIEAHRQLHETVATKHRQELTALNMLWRLYQMTGQLSPEVL